MKTADEIIQFWVEEVGEKNWYEQSDEVDQNIARRYKSLRDEAAKGVHDDWIETANGALALIILLDQFSRNLYRGDAESFAADAHARDLARQAIDKGHPEAFDYPLRQFFYMPFCHSEDIEDHSWLISVAEDAGVEENLVDFHAHHDVIEKYGRFPFRNDALGRESSDDERVFMEKGGYMNLRQKWLEKLGK